MPPVRAAAGPDRVDTDADPPLLFDPASHEPITERPWDDRRVRAAIGAIVADAESAFDADALWPAHPLDLEGGPLSRVASLYLGASGVVWALHRLASAGAADLGCDWAPLAVELVERYAAQPDFREDVDGPVPSFLMGEAGILLVAHTLAPAAWQEEQLLAAVRANAESPALELMWGSPGTMIAAQVMYERTGAAHWREAWRESADWLWAQWHDDLWVQDLYGSRVRYLGPAHGFAGNVVALAQGDGLDPARRAELELRAIAAAAVYVQRSDGLCQWPPSPDARRSGSRSRFGPSGATGRPGSSPRSRRSLRRTSS